MPPPPVPTPLQRALVLLLLPLGGWLGLQASLPGTSVGVLWPPAGLALGFLLRWGPGLWPTLLAATFLQTLLVQGLLAPEAFLANPGRAALLVGLNTLHSFGTPLLAERLVRPVRTPGTFSLREATGILVRGGLVAQTASAACGVGLFWAMGMIPGPEVPRALFVWWSSNVTAVGLLSVWMAALYHGDRPARALTKGRPALLFLGVTLATALSFFLPGWLSLSDVHLELLVVFPVLMSAFALGVSGAATAALHCATVTLTGSLLGHGAFGRSGSFTALLSLQVYLLTVMGASLALGDARRRWQEARADLERSEAWFRGIFEGVHDLVLVLEETPQGRLRVERANLRAETLLGLPPSGPAEAPALACGPLAPPHREASLERLNRGEILQETWQVPGSGLWLDGTLQVLDLEGQRRILLTLRDITDRKAAEAEGERLRGQLLQAQKMEALGLLAAGIAHDFNNLLSAQQGYTDLLEEEAPQALSPLLARLREVTTRGSSLIRALLAFSRPSGADRRVLDLNLLVADSLPLLRQAVGSKVELSFQPAPGTALVEANPNQLDQVLLNLACNARDAMAAGGTLALATSLEREGWVRLSVADTGCGMDETVQARIFEPFFTTKPAGAGTGLGLATTLDIVQSHQGSLEVSSRPGAGTTFTLQLPKQG